MNKIPDEMFIEEFETKAVTIWIWICSKILIWNDFLKVLLEFICLLLYFFIKMDFVVSNA